MSPDPKRPPRIKDPELLRQAHWAYDECVICGSINISIHHVLRRGQGGDDVWENLVALCGDGTSGCHGGVEGSVDAVCHALGRYIVCERHDTVAYLARKLGGREAAAEWLYQRYGVRL